MAFKDEDDIVDQTKKIFLGFYMKIFIKHTKILTYVKVHKANLMFREDCLKVSWLLKKSLGLKCGF